MSDLPEYVLEREFDAPIELVWRAWTDPELLQRWYGPGAETTIHRFDLVPGGEWLNEMAWGDNANYQRIVFQEVDQPNKLVWLHYSSTNANWEPVSNPMMPGWPAMLMTNVSFAKQGDKTLVTLRQVPHEASDDEIACFAEMMKNMDGGWGAGYKVIDEILAEISDAGAS